MFNLKNNLVALLISLKLIYAMCFYNVLKLCMFNACASFARAASLILSLSAQVNSRPLCAVLSS